MSCIICRWLLHTIEQNASDYNSYIEQEKRTTKSLKKKAISGESLLQWVSYGLDLDFDANIRSDGEDSLSSR